MRSLVYIFVVFAMCGLSFEVLGEPILLRYRLESGEILVYDVSMNMKMDLDGQSGNEAGSGSIEMKIGMCYALECLSASEGEFTCEAQFYAPSAEIQMDMMNSPMRIVMDSSGMNMYQKGKLIQSAKWSEFNDPSMPNIGDLLKTKIRCKFGDRGELIEVLDEEGLSSNFPGLDFNQIIGEQFVLPSHAVDIGDSWEATVATDFNGAMGGGFGTVKFENDFKYTLEKVGDYKGVRAAVIDVKGTTRTDEESLGIAFKQVLTGMTIVEVDTGKVLYTKVDIEQKADGQVSGADINMRSSGNITVRFNGNSLPSEIIEKDLWAQIDSSLLEELNKIRVPIVLTDRVKMGEKFYECGDIVTLESGQLKLLKFTDDKIYLKDESSRIIFKLVLNFRGEVTSIKPLMGK